MNLVGEHGRGESVWLGFFLYDVLVGFTEVARARGDAPFADRCLREAAQLRLNIERHGWDGEWYRRAYFDDGSPLGSSVNAECQIDSIAQSWSVLSGAGDPERARTAMAAVDARLVRREHGLIQLLDPPFDQSTLNPGYIKGYVPGRQGERRTVHACGRLGGHGLRAPGGSPAGLGSPDDDQSGEPRQNGGRGRHLQGGTLRRRGRRLCCPPHTGRGGWTWYTGSAAWMYRLMVESLLGLRFEVDRLRLTPCLPVYWEGFKLHYRHRETVYHIAVRQTPPTRAGCA